MDCVVTGGAGFIGSNLVDALLARGDRVSVIDNLSTGKRANLSGALERGAVLHEADVRDAAAVAAIFAEPRPEVVFHLAAQIDVRYSVANPAGDAEANVLGTIAVLEAARAPACGGSSTRRPAAGSTATPTCSRRPRTTRSVRSRRTARASTRPRATAGCTRGCTACRRVSLRYGNVYGPRQDVHGEAGVVAIFCGDLVEGRRPTVFGDGRQTRDWVEVSDVVRANLMAASRI